MPQPQPVPAHLKSLSLRRDVRMVKEVHSSLRLAVKTSLMSPTRLFGTTSVTTATIRTKDPLPSSSQLRHRWLTISLAVQETTCSSLTKPNSLIRLPLRSSLFLNSLRRQLATQSGSTSSTKAPNEVISAPIFLKTSMSMCIRQATSRVSILATLNYWRSE